MPRNGRVTAVPVVLMLGAVAVMSPAFLPGPAPHAKPLRAEVVVAPTAAVLGAATAAHADRLGDAAARFSEAAYPVAEKINWVNQPQIAKYIADVSATDPQGTAKAMVRLLESGLTMNPTLIYDAVKAHSNAIKSALSNPNLVTTKADFAAVNEANARMIASASPDAFFKLLYSFPRNAELQNQFYAGNDGGEARAAYKAFNELTQAVKLANTAGASAPIYSPVSGGEIGAAAKKLSDVTYPIAQKIDWGKTPAISEYIAKVATQDPKQVAQAMDKVLDVGLSMDPAAVQVAVRVHLQGLKHATSDPQLPKAMSPGSPSLMTDKSDWDAIIEQNARMIATADPVKFKSILTAFPGNAELQMKLFEAYTKVTGKEAEAFQAFEALTRAVAGAR
eukprot:TRINITY_DN1931_c0_g2_i1.p1 TRINITY_DN1931_c0_g2~~TRINITY_DN1931_c0_g2_i1.p1  ORF type:complete len:392 (-),score=105.23 TRINITY_DN1931_c0_g2_i1:527-1702(-)